MTKTDHDALVRYRHGERYRPVAALLSYDSETGEFRWKQRKSGRVAGSSAGFIHRDGYRYIACDRRQYLAHRLAWLIHYEELPSTDIDHVNGIKSDNRISNLRLASIGQNNCNRPALRKNKLGLKGVSQDRNTGMFYARIALDKKRVHLGTFSDAASAHAAYAKAAADLHGEFAHE